MKTQLATLIYRNNIWVCIIILLLLFTGYQGVSTTSSKTSNDQTSSNTPEPRPKIGTRGIGLSRAYISSVDDATSPLWNPQGALSIAYPVKVVGTFGINLLDFNNADRFLIDHNSNPIGTFEYGYNQALLSYARNFGTLQLGVSTGFSRAPYKNSLWAQNYDVGALITLSPKALVGIQFRDINGVSIRDQNGVILNTFNSQLAFGTTLIPIQHVKWHLSRFWHKRRIHNGSTLDKRWFTFCFSFRRVCTILEYGNLIEQMGEADLLCLSQSRRPKP